MKRGGSTTRGLSKRQEQVEMTPCPSHWIQVLTFQCCPSDGPANVGKYDPNARVKMIDARGREISSAGITKAKLMVTSSDGRRVEIREQLALGQVKQPLSCAGKPPRKGRATEHRECGLCLTNPKTDIVIPALGKPQYPYERKDRNGAHQQS